MSNYTHINFSICSRKDIKAKRKIVKPWGLTQLMALNRKVDRMIADGKKAEEESKRSGPALR